MVAFLPQHQWLQVVERAPLVSIDLIVRDPRDRVLLGMRNNEPARGFWFTPGGAIRKGERLDAAFTRITQAELGVALTRGSANLHGVYEHHYATNFAGAPNIGTHYVVLAHELAALKALAQLPTDQHRTWSWMTTQDLLAAPDVHLYVKDYFR